MTPTSTTGPEGEVGEVPPAEEESEGEMMVDLPSLSFGTVAGILGERVVQEQLENLNSSSSSCPLYMAFSEQESEDR